MNKKALSERDICTKFITPAIERAQWDVMTQVREEVGFTKGRVIVRGKLVSRGTPKRADYVGLGSTTASEDVVEGAHLRSLYRGERTGRDVVATLSTNGQFESGRAPTPHGTPLEDLLQPA